MCASCGCGCKHGIAAKGCTCKCKDCREARTMSVEKSYVLAKALRNFEEIEKGIPGAMKSAGMFGLKPGSTLTDRRAAYVVQRKKAHDAGREYAAARVPNRRLTTMGEGMEQRKLSRTNLDKLT